MKNLESLIHNEKFITSIILISQGIFLTSSMFLYYGCNYSNQSRIHLEKKTTKKISEINNYRFKKHDEGYQKELSIQQNDGYSKDCLNHLNLVPK